MRDRLRQNASGINTRVEDFCPIFGMISAVDASSGEVDDHVGGVEFGGPVAEVAGVPENGFHGGIGGFSAQDHDLVAFREEGAGEDVADLAGTAGKEDFHDGTPKN